MAGGSNIVRMEAVGSFFICLYCCYTLKEVGKTVICSL